MASPNPSLAAVMARALVIARGYAHAGTHEVGGNNLGDEVEFFQHVAGISPGEPWCCAFVLTCMVKAFAQLTGRAGDRASLLAIVPIFCAAYSLPRTGLCMALYLAFRRLELTRAKDAAVHAGDIVFFDFRREGVTHHVAFVNADSPAGGELQTVEGNTPQNVGDPADGDGVYAKSHDRRLVYAFGVAA